MNRRIPKTREERLSAPREVTTPANGNASIGTIQKLDSGHWSYQRKDGRIGLANTASEAVEKLKNANSYSGD